MVRRELNTFQRVYKKGGRKRIIFFTVERIPVSVKERAPALPVAQQVLMIPGLGCRRRSSDPGAIHVLICHDSSFTARTVKADSAAWLEEMERRGVRKHGDRLRPAAEVKTVGTRDGRLLWRDGRFAEIKDEVADYDIIECADFDEAIEIASKHAAAKFGRIESDRSGRL